MGGILRKTSAGAIPKIKRTKIRGESWPVERAWIDLGFSTLAAPGLPGNEPKV
jgi:hypothetical protein